MNVVGSWDHYAAQLPLSRDLKKSGRWSGDFTFPNGRPGKRYWYYVSNYYLVGEGMFSDINKFTAGCKLNKLDILEVPGSSPSFLDYLNSSSNQHNRSASEVSVPKGRPVPPSMIISRKLVHVYQFFLVGYCQRSDLEFHRYSRLSCHVLEPLLSIGNFFTLTTMKNSMSEAGSKVPFKDG